ncbi:MAG: beta-galactosidase [Candidatus Omnitrophota bacterium]
MNSAFSGDYRAAIFDEPELPVEGQATPAKTFIDVFAEEGVASDVLNADRLSDAGLFNAERYQLIVVPTGASFPLSAKDSLLAFLRQGGDMLCCGGYAFDALWMRENGQWISYKTYWEQQLERARDPQFSLVPNGGFEERRSGWTASNPADCRISEDSPYSGRYCAQVINAATGGGARWEKELSVKPGENYLIGAQVRTGDFQGTGYGYLAVYQYGANGNLLQFVDFAQFWRAQDWRRHEKLLTVDRRAVKVMFYGGLYQATGTLWFDDVTCAPMAKEEKINAHYGNPQDGLIVDASQLTLYSPDQLFAGATLKASPYLAELGDWSSPGETSGFEATAQLRHNARWIPWIMVQDERGHDAGAAGAFVEHYAGPYFRSRWALFGATNRDLFAGAQGRRLLAATLHRLRAGTMIQSLASDYALYRQGERASIQVKIHNISNQPIQASCQLSFSAPDAELDPAAFSSDIRSVSLPRNSSQTLDYSLTIPESAPDFVTIKATVKEENGFQDWMESGFCVASEKTMQKGTRIRFRDNAFEIASAEASPRRAYIWGTDTYGNMFQSPSQSPLTWFRDMQTMRDNGLHMFENLQFIAPQYQYSKTQWRQMDGIIQLSQRVGLPYMAGLLIGQNVVVDDAVLNQQAEMCRQFAARYRQVPGLIYYLNGDFQLQLKDSPDIRRLWNDFLRQRYENDDALRQVWGRQSSSAMLENIPVADHAAQSWYDVKAKDLNEFKAQLMKRWIGALCQAIRKEDGEHPITSEYYQRPYSGIDLRLTMDGMDAANFGYFDRPAIDIARLMATIKWNDMRLYGKTVNIGEFGVKTHDAWTVERGGTHYHIRRTPAEQLRLFWWVAHAALSLGATKIQNWCWSDDADSIFPWGIAWRNPSRPKPAALLYRNLRLLAEQMPPEYAPADIVFMMPDHWRLGAPENTAHTSLLNALECLLAANSPYDVIDESQLSRLASRPPRLLIAPLAYALADETVRELIQLAEKGARVYLSGDPSVNPLGRREAQRLEDICGVRYEGVSDHASGLPFVRVTPTRAKLVENLAGLSLYRCQRGSGEVFFTPEPWETFPGKDLFVAEPEITASTRANLYLSLLPLAGIETPLTIHASAGVWRSVATPSGEHRWISLFPRSVIEGKVSVEAAFAQHRLRCDFQEAIPAGVLMDKESQLLAASGSGALFIDSMRIIQGGGPWIVMSLDKQSIAQSQSLLISSIEKGRIWWSSQASGLSVWAIHWNEGKIVSIALPSPQSADGGWAIGAQPNELYLVASEINQPIQLERLQRWFDESPDSSNVKGWRSNE